MAEKNIYGELTQATPEELLNAALWFYRDYKHGLWLLQLGFKLARGEWGHIAPYWLQASKEAINETEAEE